jgi:hypothetical protein
VVASAASAALKDQGSGDMPELGMLAPDHPMLSSEGSPGDADRRIGMRRDVRSFGRRQILTKSGQIHHLLMPQRLQFPVAPD